SFIFRYTFSLHDALPIFYVGSNVLANRGLRAFALVARLSRAARGPARDHLHRHRNGTDGVAGDLSRRAPASRSRKLDNVWHCARSEEHTSELQSPDLHVC